MDTPVIKEEAFEKYRYQARVNVNENITRTEVMDLSFWAENSHMLAFVILKIIALIGLIFSIEKYRRKKKCPRRCDKYDKNIC